MPALVRPHDDAESLELALIENMAREDLNPVEEARACALLVEELGLTREDVGRRVGRSRVAVSNLLRLLDLPDEVLDLLAAGHLSEGHGRALLLASDHDDRRRLARTAVAGGLDGPPDRGAARATAERPRRAGGAPRPRRPRAASGPGRGRRAGSATRSAARSAPTSAWPRAATATASRSAFESLGRRAMALAERLGARRARLTAARAAAMIAAARAISSVG